MKGINMVQFSGYKLGIGHYRGKKNGVTIISRDLSEFDEGETLEFWNGVFWEVI